MTYQEVVAEARTLVKRCKEYEEYQWRLAQLTWENASPMEGDGKRSLTEWSRDIEVSVSYTSRLYRIWDSYQTDREMDDVQRPPFSDAYNEVSPASKYRPRVPVTSHPEPQEEEGTTKTRTIEESPGGDFFFVSEPQPFGLQEVNIHLAEIQYRLSLIADQRYRILDTDRDDIATSLQKISNHASELSGIIRSAKNEDLDEEAEAFFKEERLCSIIPVHTKYY